MKKICIYTALILCLCSCSTDLKEYFGRAGMFTPEPLWMAEIPQGDDEYSQGFRDGCNTSISITGTGLLTSAYDDIYYDFDKTLSSPMYYRGRTVGMNYCMYYLDNNPL